MYVCAYLYEYNIDSSLTESQSIWVQNIDLTNRPQKAGQFTFPPSVYKSLFKYTLIKSEQYQKKSSINLANISIVIVCH